MNVALEIAVPKSMTAPVTIYNVNPRQSHIDVRMCFPVITTVKFVTTMGIVVPGPAKRPIRLTPIPGIITVRRVCAEIRRSYAAIGPAVLLKTVVTAGWIV